MSSSVMSSVLNSTLTKSRKKLILASIKANAIVAWAFSQNRVEFEDGGHEISNPLAVGRNPNIASYRYYNPVPIAQTDEFTTVKYNWSRVAGSVIISDQEEDENRGSAQIFKLMREKINILEDSMKEKFAEYLHSAGIGNDPYGLPLLIPDDPTVGTLGTIDRALEPQWRTSSYQFAGALDETNIEEAFDDIQLDLRQKDDRPDFMLCGRNIYRTYRQAVRDKVVISLPEGGMNGRKMFDLGFEGVSHNKIPLVYDEDCPVDRTYIINSKYLRLHILRHVNMKIKELVAPWTVHAHGRSVVWQGQLCLWKAYRTHAVVNNG